MRSPNVHERDGPPLMIDAVVGGVLVGLGSAHLVYTYLAYPRLVALLEPRPPRPRADTPRGLVSIVIAARDCGSDIAGKVRQLLETVRLDCEIVVVLDGPDPVATRALDPLLGEQTRLLVLPAPVGKAFALNHAVAAARGDILIFTDVRQRITAGAVERLVGALASPDVGAVSGLMQVASPPERRGLLDHYWENEQRLREREAAYDSTVGVLGALYGIKRALWHPLPVGLLLDDVWVPMQVVKVGKRVAFEPLAIAIDVPMGSDATELVRRVRTLTGNYQLLAWMPWVLDPRANRIWWQFLSHKVLRLITPVTSGLIAAGVLILAGPWAAWLAGGAVVVALIAWAAPAVPKWFPGVRILRVVRSALVLQVALILAVVNGVRRRWDVWRDPLRPMFEDVRQS